MVEMVNRFYTYQLGVETDPAKLAEYQGILDAHLPEILKAQNDWPAGVQFISFGTLAHGFAPRETLIPPPTVAPRTAEENTAVAAEVLVNGVAHRPVRYRAPTILEYLDVPVPADNGWAPPVSGLGNARIRR
jgi:hypothetical protein